MKIGIADRRFLIFLPLLAMACGSSTQTAVHQADGSPGSVVPDGGAPLDAGPPPPSGTDAGVQTGVDAMGAAACNLPPAPADACSAVPTGKVIPCSQDGGQPSQTGYFEIDSPGAAPIYVCATSWSADPSIGYIFGQPATFLSDAQGCCGGTVTAAPAPTVPPLSVGDPGAPHIPSHVKPQELLGVGTGALRQNPFAVVVTDTASGAAATQAMATWLTFADGKPHPAPDGTGTYYFATGFPINYVIVETSTGSPVIVIGPEVSLSANGTDPIGHPSLGACAAGGGSPLALIAGEVHGTTINNHSGRYDYGPWVTADALASAAQLFNCMGIKITGTKYYAPKS
ncbi:MAG TPA: hypothetical protein VHO67_16130 [Polyangia bacterium]|nr:hypothetical protein [Polyangia bacterium]